MNCVFELIGKYGMIIPVIMMFVIGCDQPRPGYVPPPPPKPTVVVELSESSSKNSITIYFKNHKQDRNEAGNLSGPQWIVLNNIEDLNAYKKEIEFLSKRIDETIEKMTIHEDPDGQKTTSP